MNLELSTNPGSPSLLATLHQIAVPILPKYGLPFEQEMARGFDIDCIQFPKIQNLSHGLFIFLAEIFV